MTNHDSRGLSMILIALGVALGHKGHLTAGLEESEESEPVECHSFTVTVAPPVRFFRKSADKVAPEP
jgi:hypothetical protein